MKQTILWVQVGKRSTWNKAAVSKLTQVLRPPGQKWLCKRLPGRWCPRRQRSLVIPNRKLYMSILYVYICVYYHLQLSFYYQKANLGWWLNKCETLWSIIHHCLEYIDPMQIIMNPSQDLGELTDSPWLRLIISDSAAVSTWPCLSGRLLWQIQQRKLTCNTSPLWVAVCLDQLQSWWKRAKE